MDLRKQLNKIDLERLILVPLLTLLILMHAAGVYSYLMAHSFSDVTSILHTVHKGLILCFYFLTAVLFFIRSQPVATSSSLLARTLAYVGTFTPFLLIFMKNSRTATIPTLYSLFLMTCGMLFAVYSLKTLGRSFGIMPQARTLVRSGPYRLIRHPLYVGEIVAFGGAILTGFTIAKLGVFLLLTSIQAYRAIQEEKVLEETIPGYSVYKAATSRFIPGVI